MSRKREKISRTEALEQLRQTIKPGDVLRYETWKHSGSSACSAYRILNLRIHKGEIRIFYLTYHVACVLGWRLTEAADSGDLVCGITHGDLTSGLHELSRYVHGNNGEHLPAGTKEEWRRPGYTFRYERM